MVHIHNNTVEVTLIEINIYIEESLIRDIKKLMQPQQCLGISTEMNDFTYEALADKMGIKKFNDVNNRATTRKEDFEAFGKKYFSRLGFSKDKMYLVFLKNKIQ